MVYEPSYIRVFIALVPRYPWGGESESRKRDGLHEEALAAKSSLSLLRNVLPGSGANGSCLKGEYTYVSSFLVHVGFKKWARMRGNEVAWPVSTECAVWSVPQSLSQADINARFRW